MCLQMVELEDTFISQLQRVADTYKREMQEQHKAKQDLEVRLRAAQLAVHQADTRHDEAVAALKALQVSTAMPCSSDCTVNQEAWPCDDRAAQLAVHQADTRHDEAVAALKALQVSTGQAAWPDVAMSLLMS